MEFTRVRDFVNKAHEEVGRYRIEMTLTPHNIVLTDYAIPKLTWYSIKYGDEDIGQVPDDKRGIYAFGVHHASDTLPPHGYIMYIGIAGRNSKRSLRDRYRDYLTESAILKRERIARMIVDWQSVLKFFYAPVEDNVSSEDLIRTERQLNTALMPPFSVGDIEAETRRQQRAF